MEVYFIRHKNEKRPQIIQSLKEENRIAIFFENRPWNEVGKFIETGDPNNLPPDPKRKKSETTAYRTALKYFEALSQNGGYLFVEYGDAELTKESKGCFFVEIAKGTQVESLNISDCSDLIHITLKYTLRTKVNYSHYPVLLAIRPPFSTICITSKRTYPKIAGYLREPSILLPPSLDLLHPKMMEQMCVEYLLKRGLDHNGENSKLDYCFLKPGKNLAYIDIAGRLNNGQILYAQVKNSPINKRDEANFKKFIQDQSNVAAVIFADFNKDNQNAYSLKESIHYIDIQDVFNEFKHNNQMMEDMIGFPLIKSGS